MPILIPVTSHGNREIVVDTQGGGIYRFRTYYSVGQYDGWFLDVSDLDGVPLHQGIRITPGCPNILKGQGETFRGVQLTCVVTDGVETSPDALGNGTYLVWFNPGEKNPYDVGDPLINIPYDEWAFGHRATHQIFGDDGHGSVHVNARVAKDASDDVSFIRDGGAVLRGVLPVGSENKYMRVSDSGSIAIKGAI